jgi:hypothetical protein
MIDLLKIDVEGLEGEVVLGFLDTIRKRKIRCIQFEYGYANVLSHFLLFDFYRRLEPMGYVVGKIFPDRVEFRPYSLEMESFKGPNYIAVLVDQQVLIRQLSGD